MVAEYRVYLVYTSWYGHLNRENAHQPGDLGVPWGAQFSDNPKWQSWNEKMSGIWPPIKNHRGEARKLRKNPTVPNPKTIIFSKSILGNTATGATNELNL
jgi:hypothetical protein